jgi:N-methylhydantoinase B/oxoprolinase/acetone carboxylase alpha subunit
MPPQDLVYSVGLIDYFNDPFVLKLMNYAHALLRPGGRLILHLPGGGGFGDPAQRSDAERQADLTKGYVTDPAKGETA